MDLPHHWRLLALLACASVLCQDYPEGVPPPPDYADLYAAYPLGCAPECSCPPSHPYAMYCNNRELTSVPAVPRHIRHLYVQANAIEGLTAGPFANASALTDVNLSHNRLRSPLVDRKALAGLTSLLHLHLDHNELEEVPPSLPKSLQRLFLASNKISKLSADDLHGLAGVAVLDLCNNRLTDVKGKALAAMKGLMQVSLCGNKLRSMPSELPGSLLQLSVDHNAISSIPEGYFRKTPNLMSLRASYNKLTDVPYEVFNLSSLLELNLGHNQLSSTFYVPRALQHLYLNDNEFHHVNISLMCPSVNRDNPNLLTYIRIDNNRLKRALDNYVYACFPRIHTIFYGEQKAEKREEAEKVEKVVKVEKVEKVVKVEKVEKKPPPTTKKRQPPIKKDRPRQNGR